MKKVANVWNIFSRASSGLSFRFFFYFLFSIRFHTYNIECSYSFYWIQHNGFCGFCLMIHYKAIDHFCLLSCIWNTRLVGVYYDWFAGDVWIRKSMPFMKSVSCNCLKNGSDCVDRFRDLWMRNFTFIDWYMPHW